jgi:hypothetical protein
MRSGVVALLAAAAIGVVALAVAAGVEDRRLAFTIGVAPTGVAATLAPGDRVCQAPVTAATEFSRVRFQVGTFRRAGVPLEVAVRSAGSGAVLADGRLAGGYPDVSQPSVPLDRPVRESQRIAVCIRNTGDRKIALYGGSGLAARNSSIVVDGKPGESDLTLIFERSSPRSVLSQVPDMFQRASLFRPGWVTPGLFWALALVLALGVPALLALAMRAAGESEPERADRH